MHTHDKLFDGEDRPPAWLRPAPASLVKRAALATRHALGFRRTCRLLRALRVEWA